MSRELAFSLFVPPYHQPLAFPCNRFYNQVRWLFFTELVSDFPRHTGGGRLSHRELNYSCDAFWAAVSWNVFIWKDQLWKSDFTFWVANEITAFMPNWDWYCTLRTDKELLCLTLQLPLMKGFPSQIFARISKAAIAQLWHPQNPFLVCIFHRVCPEAAWRKIKEPRDRNWCLNWYCSLSW